MKRNAITIVLAAAALLTGGVVLAQTGWLVDVPIDHPRQAAIQEAFSRGWITGYEDRTFRPDDSISAGQMARIIGRKFGEGAITRGVFAELIVNLERDQDGLTTRGERTAVNQVANLEGTVREMERQVCDLYRYWKDMAAKFRQHLESEGISPGAWGVQNNYGLYPHHSGLEQDC